MLMYGWLIIRVNFTRVVKHSGDDGRRDVHFRSLHSTSAAAFHDTYTHLKREIHLKLSERVLKSEGESAISLSFSWPRSHAKKQRLNNNNNNDIYIALNPLFVHGALH